MLIKLVSLTNYIKCHKDKVCGDMVEGVKGLGVWREGEGKDGRVQASKQPSWTDSTLSIDLAHRSQQMYGSKVQTIRNTRRLTLQTPEPLVPRKPLPLLLLPALLRLPLWLLRLRLQPLSQTSSAPLTLFVFMLDIANLVS